MEKRKKRSSIAVRLAALGVGCVAAALLLETGLRVTGAVMRIADRAGEDAGGARYTILCEGDSFTYGMGGEDYPGHLERTLNRRAGKRLYRVVNKGLPGMNTAILAEGLERRIERYRPDVLIALAGEDNAWNTLGLDVAGAGSLRHRADAVLLRSRAYKFVKMLAIGMRRDGFSRDRTGEPHAKDDFPSNGYELYLRARALEERREYAPARKLYEEFAALNPGHPAGYGFAAGCLMKEGRTAEAIELYKRAAGLKTAPDSEMIYLELGYAYLRGEDADEARRWWKKGLSLFPDSNRLYQALARLHHKRGEVEKALAYAREFPAVRANAAYGALEKSVAANGGERKTGMRQFMARSAAGRAPDALDARISRGLHEDVRRIHAIAKRRGVRVLFASYPDHVYPEVLAGVQEANGLFVDLRDIFKREFKSREDYISEDDCHPNTAGYRVMAETLAGEIERLLGRSPAKNNP